MYTPEISGFWLGVMTCQSLVPARSYLVEYQNSGFASYWVRLAIDAGVPAMVVFQAQM